VSVARAPEAAWPRARAQFTALYTGTLLVVLVGGALALRFALHATLARQFTDTVTASATLWLPTTSSTPICCADMRSWGMRLHSPSSCTAAMYAVCLTG
jgi:threonine/homoserine efflux transporter RhtA